ncbi:MAG: hypothetical protein KJ799_03640 [Bacteroidetes bacterium]|nr:hypothetical protein [Bacteroidota bacterium]MBU1679449.1 hypothetical protein [Bacteroidota bacterium]MBU2505801.1 hypothetical protein [Bacteroidota bacterium]
MIVKDKRIDKVPHGNTVIWRYLSLDKFLDLIVSKELFFTNAAKMTDKYEGLIPKRNQEYLLKQIKKEGYSLKYAEIESQIRLHQTNSLRELTLLNCWTISQHESYALWKIYLGGAKSGVAIKTTVGKLTRAIKNGKDPFDEDIFIAKVDYADFIKDEPENRFNVITTKNKFYEYENELRLFIFHYPLSEGSLKPPYNLSIGRRLKVDIYELIDEIYLSPFTGRWFDNTMVELIKQINPDLRRKIKNSEILDE